MLTVGQLAQHLLSLDPKKSPARLAFYHFLKNHLSIDAEFRQEMIDQFYDRALTFQYWQQEKKTLGDVVRKDLEAVAARNNFGFDLDQVVHSDDIQVLAIEHFREFSLLVEKEMKKLEKQGEYVRTFPLNDHQILCVRLLASGQVLAEVRQDVAFISSGELQLVRPNMRLTYTHEIELDPEADQVIETSLMRFARFNGDGRMVKGNYLQGYCFHRTESFAKPLAEVPELFQAIKKLERFYINPVTDPFYSQFMQAWTPTSVDPDV